MFKTLTTWLAPVDPVKKGELDPRRAVVLAILDIYKRYGVYIGGRLEFADLVKEWPSAGFRRGDLESGLDDAVNWGLLQLNEDDGEPTVTLLSTDMPSYKPGQQQLVNRLRDQASDRSLQLQRFGHAADASGWHGPNRRAGR